VPARSGGLFVARLVAESGIATLLEALDLYPGACVSVIGAGPKRTRLEAHPRVTLLGRLKPREVRERMRAALYLVVPCLSCDEAPAEVMDAFASGLPVIGSRLPAIEELVDPGRNGLLFEAGAARELARRLAWAEAFPERMRQMGECARADYDARYAGLLAASQKTQRALNESAL
jgi:glycosyltransferase involved in cell wall biosynthesis